MTTPPPVRALASALLSLATLTACDNDFPPDFERDASTIDTTSSVGTAIASPDGSPLRSGTYAVMLDGIPSNDCGALADSVPNEPVVLEWLDDAHFTWLDGTECAVWDGTDYACDLTVSRRAVAPAAELVVSKRAVGLILDTESLEEEQEVRIECRGSGCETYATAVGADFPCEMWVETTPMWRAH